MANFKGVKEDSSKRTHLQCRSASYRSSSVITVLPLYLCVSSSLQHPTIKWVFGILQVEKSLSRIACLWCYNLHYTGHENSFSSISGIRITYCFLACSRALAWPLWNISKTLHRDTCLNTTPCLWHLLRGLQRLCDKHDSFLIWKPEARKGKLRLQAK